MVNGYDERIYAASALEYPELLEVWECSVKATHVFLADQDFEYYKNIIPTFFAEMQLNCIKSFSGKILGFTATKNGVLEMLFVRDNYRGNGIGKKLLIHAVETLKVTYVDVNEQNEAATAFYIKHGFQLMKRSDSDGFGKPYPILHLQLL